MTSNTTKSSPLTAILLALIVAGIVSVGLSPYFTLYEMKKAIHEGNADKLSTFIDFPSVRENFKSSLDGAANRQLKDNPAFKGNPLAQVGLMFGAAVADTAIDALVSPRSVATLLIANSPREAGDSNKPSDETPPQASKPKSALGFDCNYESFNQFGARIKNKNTGELGPHITLTRSGLFTWKVTKISL